MRFSTLLVIGLCAACNNASQMYPAPPGGSPDAGVILDGPSVTPDAPPPDGTPPSGDAGGTLTGRVCLASDPRDLRTCAATGAGGLLVQLGPASAMTADDGSFTITAMPAAGAAWQVSGANIVTSYMLLPDYQIPVITKATYAAMLAANSVTLQPGQGALMVSLVSNGGAPAGAIATSAPIAFYDPFYDGSSATTWNQGTGAGPDGTVWVPGLDVGTATVTVKPTAGQAETSPSQPIADGAITYAVMTFP